MKTICLYSVFSQEVGKGEHLLKFPHFIQIIFIQGGPYLLRSISLDILSQEFPEVGLLGDSVKSILQNNHHIKLLVG